jgi:hypothetical protein
MNLLTLLTLLALLTLLTLLTLLSQLTLLTILPLLTLLTLLILLTLLTLSQVMKATLKERKANLGSKPLIAFNERLGRWEVRLSGVTVVSQWCYSVVTWMRKLFYTHTHTHNHTHTITHTHRPASRSRLLRRSLKRLMGLSKRHNPDP